MKKMLMAAGMAAVMTACGTSAQKAPPMPETLFWLSIQLLLVFHRSTGSK